MRKERMMKYCAAIAALFLLGPALLPAATYTVINTNASGTGSLAEAVTSANTNSGLDTIDFAIPGPGPHQITVSASLDLTDTAGTTVDGTTQSGYAGTPLVRVDGNSTVANGFVLTGSNSTIKGLCITRFTGSAISVSASSTTVQSCYLGTDETGTTAQANGNAISINDGTANVIGGSGVGEGNLIAGNTGQGVLLSGGSVTNTIIAGNRFGCNAAGTAGLSNASGVYLSGAGTGNVIGGATTGHRNIFGDSTDRNIRSTLTTASGQTIEGNYFGVDPSGTALLGSLGWNIEINGPGYTIKNNVISGRYLGVLLNGVQSTGHVIQGNYIGTNATGTAAIGNSFGVGFLGSANTVLVGGTNPGEGNLISGNGVIGLTLQNGGHTVTVQGNVVGLNAAGTAAIPNTYAGLVVGTNAGNNNVFGGSTAGARNVVSGNGSFGIRLADTGGSGQIAQGNWVGLNLAGTAAIPNGTGIRAESPNGQVLDNVVAGNTVGISVGSTVANGIVIRGNKVGTNPAGTTSIANGTGILIESPATNTTIGGTTTGQENLISGNTGTAVDIASGSGNTSVQGNIIGTTADGSALLGNGGAGVAVGATSTGNQITGNVIRASGTSAISLDWPGLLTNDVLDADSGSNNRQNSPLIDPIRPGDTQITVHLAAALASSYRIDVYRNSTCSDTGLAEAELWLGNVSLITGLSGTGSTIFALPSAAVAGTFYTATATDGTNSTSALSPCFPVETEPQPQVLSINRVGAASVAESSTANFDITYSEPVRSALSSTFIATQTGSLTGSTITGEATAFGKALELHSAETINTPANAVDLTNKSFTVEFWAYRYEIPGTGSTNTIPVSLQRTPSNPDSLHFGWLANGKFTFAYDGNALNTPQAWGVAFDWEHWAVTLDSGTLARKIYRNGVLVAQDIAPALVVNPGVLTLGSNPQGDFNGTIDELRIWNVVRTQAEIAGALYSPLTGSESGLLALYQFTNDTTAVADTATGGLYSLTNPTSAISTVTSTVYATTLRVLAQSGTGAGNFGLALNLPGSTADKNGYGLLSPAVATQTYAVPIASSTGDWMMLND